MRESSWLHANHFTTKSDFCKKRDSYSKKGQLCGANKFLKSFLEGSVVFVEVSGRGREVLFLLLGVFRDNEWDMVKEGFSLD